MIKGPRRSAKQAVAGFIRLALMKLDVRTEGLEPIRAQLIGIQSICKEMGWTDLEKRIDQSLNQNKGEKNAVTTR